MVALGAALQALGVQVRVCAPPDKEFADLLAGADLPSVPFERPWRSWVRPSTAQERTQRVDDFIAAQYDTLLAAAAECDVLVATAMSHFVAQSVAEKWAIPHRYAMFAPSVVHDQDAQNWNALFGPPINSHRTSIGLVPVPDIRRFMFTDQPWLAADPTLGPWPESGDLEAVQTGAWILPDERALPSALQAFLSAGAPPVYVGFGSMRTVAPDTAQAGIEAVRAQGRRVLLARGWAGLAAADEREDCFVIGEVNQQALFRRVAAVVHHGGAGTTTTAALAGTPQVIVPQAGGDQLYWARRAEELGIGAAHDGATPTVASLSASLHTALTPESLERATAIAGTIRTDGATAAARLLLEMDSGIFLDKPGRRAR
jgi:vancomycin aglycone glucosyltransferase